MKKLLNTVYVTTQECALRKDGENIVVSKEDVEIGRIPLHMLSSLVLFGCIFVSPALIGACAEKGISIVLLQRNGRFQARIEGPVHGNVLLRRAQYELSKNQNEIAKSFVIGKISNQRAVLMRALRDYGDNYTDDAKCDIERTTKRLAQSLLYITERQMPLDELMGLEGDAAKNYFSVFNHLIRSPDQEFSFSERTRRPPRDPVNALLSFFYTLLTHDCRSAAESVGLDPAVGFLHRDRPGRPSLALDMMEELRPVIVDRLVLALINRRQIRTKDFETLENEAVLLKEKARKNLIEIWQERKKETRIHPFISESAPLGLVPHLQAQLLARHIRGDLDAYPPWFWK